jgi:Ca2+-binding RTX toxin-like protein
MRPIRLARVLALVSVLGASIVLTAPVAHAQDCTVTGTEGNDTLVGTEFPEVICGLGGKDTLVALGDDDELYGGDGNDTLSPGAHADYVDGGAGFDGVTYASSLLGGFTIDLEAGTADGPEGNHDTLVSIENATGSSASDLITGDGGKNVLYGLGGDDVILGGAGPDYLYGQAGNDSLSGGDANDNLFGGDGDDGLDGGANTARPPGDSCNGGDHLEGDSAVNCEAETGVP